MNDFYKYPDLSSIEANPEFLRMQQLMCDRIKSIRETNEILASVETINDGIVFSTETKYYGDWFR